VSIFSDVVNGMRDGLLSSHEIQNRKEAKKMCQIAKIVCVAAAVIVATATIFSLLSATFAGVLFGVVLGGGTLVVLHDAYRFLDNVNEMIDDAIVEVTSRWTKQTLSKQLTKGMFVATPLVTGWIDRMHTRS
jgi:hypothetical protein